MRYKGDAVPAASLALELELAAEIEGGDMGLAVWRPFNESGDAKVGVEDNVFRLGPLMPNGMRYVQFRPSRAHL